MLLALVVGGMGLPGAAMAADPVGAAPRRDGAEVRLLEEVRRGAYVAQRWGRPVPELREGTVVVLRKGRARARYDTSGRECPLEWVDLDGDGQPELRTCDDRLIGRWCDAQESPRPSRVFAWDRRARRFVDATERFAPWLLMEGLERIRDRLAHGGLEPAVHRCLALRPALHWAMIGRVEDGRRLFRDLYPGDDAAAIEEEAFGVVATPLLRR